MKKITALLLLTLIVGMLASCSLFSEEDEGTVRVGYMSGPTAIGMAKLIGDNKDSGKYSFKKYENTTLAKADLAAGNIDIICLPTNEAVAYYSAVDGEAKILAVNCLNSLFYISRGNEAVTSLSDLEGKTIYTCKNGTPRIILEYILEKAGIDATVSTNIDGKEILTPAMLSEQAVNGSIPNAVMPEPVVTSTILTVNSSAASDDLKWSSKINFSAEWESICETPMTMGCIIASGEFINKSKKALDSFLDEYKASVEYIGNAENLDSAANYIVETGIMGAAPAAKKTLTNLSGAIVYIDGEQMKNALIGFYSAIGVSLPADSFYYEK